MRQKFSLSGQTPEIFSQVWRLALPVMLTNFLQSLVNVVDIFMVGRLGPLSIAAVGMGGIIRMLVLVMMLSGRGRIHEPDRAGQGST